MVDDSSKRESDKGTGLLPSGESTPENIDVARSDADSILRLLSARLELSDMDQHRASGDDGGAVSSSRDVETEDPRVIASGPRDSIEMTPAPMVVASTMDGTPASPQYHAPRKPPTSIAPPPAAASFSVAPQYDPKAPTRPKARRNTSAPPPPLLFGLDRMLVWGLVLGGFFVAAIVVIVRQLALPSAQRPVPAAIGHEREPSPRVAREQLIQQGELGSVSGPGHDSLDAGLEGAGTSTAAGRDSTNPSPAQADEKARPSGIGGGSATLSGQSRPSRAGTLRRKSWIE